MSSKIALHIVYNTSMGRPFTAAKSFDSALIIQVAKNSIKNAYREAAALSLMDDLIGKIKSEEAVRLEKVLITIVPGLQK